MSDLSAFLLARIAEDEARANHAKWAMQGEWFTTADNKVDEYVRGLSPARVLAECAAIRRVTELFEEERVRADIYNRGYDDGLLTTNNDLRSRLASNARCQGLKESLLALATIWSDHDDYREEWA